MLKIRRTSQFKKDVKRMLKRGKDLEKLLLVVQDLSARRKLPARYQDHPLEGQRRDKRDCHIEPDDFALCHRKRRVGSIQNRHALGSLSGVNTNAFLYPPPARFLAPISLLAGACFYLTWRLLRDMPASRSGVRQKNRTQIFADARR
jgi:mRNA interferase YafQ